jgi:hypothetical protein
VRFAPPSFIVIQYTTILAKHQIGFFTKVCTYDTIRHIFVAIMDVYVIVRSGDIVLECPTSMKRASELSGVKRNTLVGHFTKYGYYDKKGIQVRRCVVTKIGGRGGSRKKVGKF